MKKPRALPVDEIAARYRAGATLRELALDYETDREELRQRLIAAGVTMRPAQRRTPPLTARQRRILSAYVEGALDVREIASAFGVSAKYVHRLVRRTGTAPRLRRGPPPVIETTECDVETRECGASYCGGRSR